MSKYLKLKFENAGLFTTNRHTKDYVCRSRKNGTFKRADVQNENFEEPITIYQVSNLIHVLFGERPVPTFRKVFYKPIKYYFDKAGDSFLEIDNYKRFNKSKNIREFVKEKMTTKKIGWNSYKKKVDINWYVIKKYLTDADKSFETYNFFVSECNKLFGYEVTTKPFADLRSLFLLNQSNTTSILDFITSKLKSGLTGYLMDEKLSGSTITVNYINATTRTENYGLSDVTLLDGTIYVPISDDDITRLNNVSSCVATLLDGGLVYIDSIVEDYEIDYYNLSKVSNISIKKIKKDEIKDKVDEK